MSDIQDVYVSTDVEKSEVISENISPDMISFKVVENFCKDNFQVLCYDENCVNDAQQEICFF